MTTAAACDTLEEQYLAEGGRGQTGERNKTSILLRVSTGTKPRPDRGRGERAAQRFRRAKPWPLLFGPTERNKITQVLLRWPGAAAREGPPAGWKLSIKLTISGLFTRAEKRPRGPENPVDLWKICAANTRQQQQPPGHKKTARPFGRAVFCRPWIPRKGAAPGGAERASHES